MMNVSTPSWNGHDFYKGQTMHRVQKIVCHAAFPDDKTYYLVEWVNWQPFSPTWIERDKLFQCQPMQKTDKN